MGIAVTALSMGALASSPLTILGSELKWSCLKVDFDASFNAAAMIVFHAPLTSPVIDGELIISCGADRSRIAEERRGPLDLRDGLRRMTKERVKD